MYDALLASIHLPPPAGAAEGLDQPLAVPVAFLTAHLLQVSAHRGLGGVVEAGQAGLKPAACTGITGQLQLQLFYTCTMASVV